MERAWKEKKVEREQKGEKEKKARKKKSQFLDDFGRLRVKSNEAHERRAANLLPTLKLFSRQKRAKNQGTLRE